MYGIVVSVRLRRQSKETVMFVKHRPDDIQNFDNKLCPKEQYALKYSLPHHATNIISTASIIRGTGEENGIDKFRLAKACR
ncbi:hypothetical protein OS493_038475 [Desmophyllum pertusum]|uniref:Uncharacterized protein n=1 Tax=Desmophyllum pertusum TaxID=174260 RepID=A0A9W9YIX8_9CNID|nr:hypothetical protein OS493_038475 [Desmophyllum pertusum]